MAFTLINTDPSFRSSTLDQLVKSRFSHFSVILANPGSWSGAGARIQQMQQVLAAPGLLHAGAGLSKLALDLIQGPA